MLFSKKLAVLSFALFISILAEAETNTYFPHQGRLSTSGMIASDVKTIAGDGMLPVYGNQQGFAFADLMADYGSNDTYLLSPGAGYRKIVSNQIIGGYFFGDYERTDLGTNFWVLNPGIEWMNTRWDAHVNGYFPTDTSQQSGPVNFASNYGDYSSVSFEEGTHNQYDNLVAPFAVIGNGVDGEIGFSFSEVDNLRSRVYAGVYYYQPPSSDNVDDITGVTAGFEQPLSKNLKISVFNSYDNLNHDVVGVALTATFGEDSTVFSNNINDRLLDPVERHVGIIDTGAGTYDQQHLESMGQSLQYDDVYFVEPSPTGDTLGYSAGYGDTPAPAPADIGTYGNPAPFDQATLTSINQLSPTGSRIYIQGGTNANYYVDSSTAEQSSNPNDDYGLVLFSNQDLYGRNADYTAPAASNERPQIFVDGESNYNGFIITGTENTLSDLVITTQSGYINGSTPTTSTGVIAYNESETNQTININNTSISGFADGMYAQNDSNAGTMTINATNSHFDNNGGDEGGNNILVTGYKNYGSAGLIAINNDGNSNGLMINATNSSFDNNGTFSGTGSGINNNDNVSVASGLTAINNSNTGGLTINADHSTFNNNGMLSGLNTYILANEAGPNFNSINTAAATGLYALDNSSGNGAMTINATYTTFNNNGTLSGENALIQGGGNSDGDNVNNAVAAGVYVFNNSFGGSASGLITLNATHSTFDNNGTLSGSGSNIFILADNGTLGASENAAVAAGVFSFNNSDNLGSININANYSTFNNNGTLSGDNTYIYAHTTGVTGNPESVVASASGILAYNSGNQGSNNGSTTITADYSSFNNNGALSGSGADIQSVNDNGYGTGSAAMASASGISGYNIATGTLTINAEHSEFNNNAALTGAGTNITASGSDVNTNAASGLFVLNNSPTSGDIYVNDLSNSSFNNNGIGTTGYGIYAYAPFITGTTSVNYTGATFGGGSQTNTNQEVSSGTTDWTPS
jgi:hypothetical protein